MKKYGLDEINEWNNPLKDIATDYWQNGGFTEYGGCYQVTLKPDELMLVLNYMILGKAMVEKINKEAKEDEIQ